jgi:hypothetical protein
MDRKEYDGIYGFLRAPGTISLPPTKDGLNCKVLLVFLSKNVPLSVIRYTLENIYLDSVQTIYLVSI